MSVSKNYKINTINDIYNIDKEVRILKKSPRNIKFFNPKTFKELDNFFKNKNPLVINNIGRTFEVYGILYYLKKKLLKIYYFI